MKEFEATLKKMMGGGITIITLNYYKNALIYE